MVQGSTRGKRAVLPGTARHHGSRKTPGIPKRSMLAQRTRRRRISGNGNRISSGSSVSSGCRRSHFSSGSAAKLPAPRPEPDGQSPEAFRSFRTGGIGPYTEPGLIRKAWKPSARKKAPPPPPLLNASCMSISDHSVPEQASEPFPRRCHETAFRRPVRRLYEGFRGIPLFCKIIVLLSFRIHNTRFDQILSLSDHIISLPSGIREYSRGLFSKRVFHASRAVRRPRDPFHACLSAGRTAGQTRRNRSVPGPLSPAVKERTAVRVRKSMLSREPFSSRSPPRPVRSFVPVRDSGSL